MARQTGHSCNRSPPIGIAHLNGDRVDVVSEGDFINAGQPVEVARVDGNRIVVRLISEPTEGGQSSWK